MKKAVYLGLPLPEGSLEEELFLGRAGRYGRSFGYFFFLTRQKETWGYGVIYILITIYTIFPSQDNEALQCSFAGLFVIFFSFFFLSSPPPSHPWREERMEEHIPILYPYVPNFSF